MEEGEKWLNQCSISYSISRELISRSKISVDKNKRLMLKIYHIMILGICSILPESIFDIYVISWISWNVFRQGLLLKILEQFLFIYFIVIPII